VIVVGRVRIDLPGIVRKDTFLSEKSRVRWAEAFLVGLVELPLVLHPYLLAFCCGLVIIAGENMG
jgi:hypothetical protein